METAFFMLDRKALKRHVKTLWAAHLYLHHTQDPHEIAKLIRVPVKTLGTWMQLRRWKESLRFWNREEREYRGNDLQYCEKIWTSLADTGWKICEDEVFDTEQLHAK